MWQCSYSFLLPASAESCVSAFIACTLTHEREKADWFFGWLVVGYFYFKNVKIKSYRARLEVKCYIKMLLCDYGLIRYVLTVLLKKWLQYLQAQHPNSFFESCNMQRRLPLTMVTPKMYLRNRCSLYCSLVHMWPFKLNRTDLETWPGKNRMLKFKLMLPF